MKPAVRRFVRRGLDRALRRRGYRITPVRERDPYLDTLHDASAPQPPGAAEALRRDHPRLVELREAYDDLEWPVCNRTRWTEDLMDSWWTLQYFRGDTPYVWHYRESERVSRLKYFVFLRDVLRRDPRGLVQLLGEDGLFGCWTYRFEGYPACSRDLLDSVNELTFLDEHVSLLTERVRVLDVGAGYGRLAHRTTQAAGSLADYCCVDAIPESTFLCEYYTHFREVCPPVRVLPLPDVGALEPGSFDIAFNVHSFSECSYAAVEWWLEHLVRLRVPRLFVVPNEPEGFLTLEGDGGRLDYGSLIADAGYELVAERCAFEDPAVRELLEVSDRYCLFERRA